MSFLGEMRRRKVFRVAGVYAVVAWLIAQVVSVLNAPLNLPDGLETVILVLLGIGFPIALVLAWAYELTPDGIERAAATDEMGRLSRFELRAIDVAIVVGLAGVLAYTFWDRTTERDPQGETAITVAENPTLAVLPFDDLSPAADQEHLAHGIAEEVHTQLARLEGLRLIGRASATSFAGSAEDLRGIGEKLGASYIVGGNVRRDDERLRVTAWLSDARTGVELWNQPYDQRINDIFAIEGEIARAVAGALSIALGVAGRDLPGAGTDNLEAYDAYLRGRSADRATRSEEAIVHLNRAIALDENYAAAWARLGIATGSTQWSQQPEQARETRERARGYVLHALELDPSLAEAHSNLAAFNGARKDWRGMEEEHQRAIALAPADFARLGSYGITLGRAGRIRRALELEARARDFDPFWAGLSNFMAAAYLSLHRYADARAELERARSLGASTLFGPLHVAMSEGEPDVVREQLQAAIEISPPRLGSLLASVLGAVDSPTEVRAELHRYYAAANWSSPEDRALIASLAGYFGDPELSLTAMTDELRDLRLRATFLWYPYMSEMRQLPGFKNLVTELGLVDYWRNYGWTDFCTAIGADDFVCE
jgi:TolB-like protein/Flp pilus assembly protein TadD